MNLFELYAKISVDDTGFKKSMESAQQVSKNVAMAMQNLQSPLDKAKSGFNAIAHPVETVKANIEKLKNATEAIRHPIETFKNKVADASAALETKRNKLSTLAAGYDSAKKKVADITKEFNKSAKESGTSSQKTQKLAKKLNEAEKEAEEAKKELDAYSASVSKAGKNSDSASKGVGNFASKLGKGLATAGKVAGAALGAAAAGVTALTTQAVNSFAEYEQLAGGAEKIFDEMSQTKILGDARNAYKELGLSMNEYLAVINDVGATFAQTMGDEAGYEAAKTGLKAISDYASGTGKNVDELSQKFTLITRSTSSYQSIADQFSGILPATSAGFLEQAQAAGFLEDSYKSLTEVPIAEYQQAVTDMLEQGVADLGLANNTAMEAATTISGSLAALGASWKNLITGIGDGNANLDGLMDDFIGSVKNATKNIMPTIGTALNGIGKLIQEVVPVAMQYIPQIIGEFLPTIGEAAIGIVTSIGTSIFDNIDQILEWGQNMLDTLLDGINSNTGNISSAVTEILTTFGSFILDNLPEIIMAGLNILIALVGGIVGAIPELATAATKAIIELAAYLISAENLEKIISLGADLINALADGIENVVAELVSVGEDIIESIKDGISSAWEGLKTWFNNLWNSLFGNRNVDVNVNTSGSHAGGLAYVPFDGYIAELHKGERVLTASEAREYNSGASANNTSKITIIQNIQSVPQTPVELAAATSAYFEQARWAF